MTTLYVSDMDGTLLGADSRVSPRSAKIISELTLSGALITVATARTPATVVPLLKNTLTKPDAIVMTGVALWSREMGIYRDVHHIVESDYGKIVDVCHNYNINPFVYTLETSSFINVYHEGRNLNPSERVFYEERCHLALKHFYLATPVLDGKKVILCYAVGHHKHIFAAAEELHSRGNLSVSCYYDIFDHDIAHLEIFATGVSKAAAVANLKRQVGADRVVVFGDNLNDIPMMKVADYAVAVGNAFDQVKDMADIVIGSNTTDSVARFIQEDFE